MCIIQTNDSVSRAHYLFTHWALLVMFIFFKYCWYAPSSTKRFSCFLLALGTAQNERLLNKAFQWYLFSRYTPQQGTCCTRSMKAPRTEAISCDPRSRWIFLFFKFTCPHPSPHHNPSLKAKPYCQDGTAQQSQKAHWKTFLLGLASCFSCQAGMIAALVYFRNYFFFLGPEVFALITQLEIGQKGWGNYQKKPWIKMSFELW